MEAQIRSVMLDTTRPDVLIAFWSELLGVDVDRRIGGYTWLAPTNAGGVSLGFQHVGESDDHRGRVHLDVLVDDKDEATRRVVELGGALVQQQGINNIVADPDGNRFCVYTEG